MDNNIEDSVIARAPGKILWLGGYSVVERSNVSFVTTVDSYVHARVSRNEGDEVRLSVPQFNIDIKGKVDRSTGTVSIDQSPQLRLVVTAMDLASKYVLGTGATISGFSIETQSDQPMMYHKGPEGRVIKSGLGSSAAVTVATIAAILDTFGVDPDRNDALHKLAQLSHGIATGKVGSGFDVAAAVHGSCVYTRYTPEIVSSFPNDYTVIDTVSIVKKQWDYSVQKATLPKVFDIALASFADESAITASLIGEINKFKARNPAEYVDIIVRINSANVAALDALSRIETGDGVQAAMQDFKRAFDEGRALTKLLGKKTGVAIEPDAATELIEQSKFNGAFVAKLPGAGGMDSIAALCTKESRDGLVRFWSSNPSLEIMGVKSSNAGYSIERKRRNLEKTRT